MLWLTTSALVVERHHGSSKPTSPELRYKETNEGIRKANQEGIKTNESKREEWGAIMVLGL